MSSSLFMLLASLAGLALGPVLIGLGRRAAALGALVDGFALIVVGGLATLHLVPEALAQGGATAAALLLAGAVAPSLLERRYAARGATFMIVLLVAGLLPHAALESAALGATQGDHAARLGLAIAAHRLPIGLLVYSLARRHIGTVGAWAALSALIVATLGGFVWGSEAAAEAPWLVWLEAFVAGSLLHVAFSHPWDQGSVSAADCAHTHHAHDHAHGHNHHGHDHASPPSAERLASIGGVAVGALALGWALSGEVEGHDHALAGLAFGDTFIALALESAPALLIAYALAGLVRALVTPAGARWLQRGGALGRTARGVAFGLPLPICSCGVLPVYESLVRRGVPATAAMGFLIATPELGLDALLLSVPLLGPELTLARLAAALLVALGVGWAVGRLADRAHAPASAQPLTEPREPWPARIREGLRFGFVELVDHTLPWIAAGLVIAAWVEPILSHGALASIPASLQVPLFALIGVPIYVCASGATPIAAIAIHKGISAGAAIAFLLAGPATNVTTFGILSRLHGRRVAALFGLGVCGLAVACGYVVDAVVLAAVPDLHDWSGGEGAWYQWACLWALVAIAAASLWRQGPRGVVGQLIHPVHAH